MQVCKPCHFKAVDPFKLHPIFMAYLYEAFEHLLRFWMGIWLHTHNIITTDISPNFLELCEILTDSIVQMMPLRFD
jgi:hypothetical protein